MNEQFEDIPSLPASAKAQSPSVKDALATQSTQAEPAGVDELKAALIQVQRENRHLEAQLETMREQHHLVAQLLAARLKQQDETDSKGVQDT